MFILVSTQTADPPRLRHNVARQDDSTSMCECSDRGEESVGLGSEGQQGDADPITEIHTRSFVHPACLISGAPHILLYLLLNAHNSMEAT